MNFSSNYFSEAEVNEESSNFFFHFTSEIKHLVSIMNNNFMPFYCMEGLHFLNMPDIDIEGMAYPVVCFCDIPISRHKEHKTKFGKYGIGLKKNWGIKNHLTPVIYSHINSITSSSLKILFELAISLKPKLSDEEFRKFNNSISTLMMHYKSYEGFQYNKENNVFSKKPTKFYDEREWRYIPLKVDGLKLNLEVNEYRNKKTLEEANKKIQEYNIVEFTIDDVEYIFLNDESELEEFLSKLNAKYSKQDIEMIRNKTHFD